MTAVGTGVPTDSNAHCKQGGCRRGGVRGWDRCPNPSLSPSQTPLVKPAGRTFKPMRNCLPHSRMGRIKSMSCCSTFESVFAIFRSGRANRSPVLERAQTRVASAGGLAGFGTSRLPRRRIGRRPHFAGKIAKKPAGSLPHCADGLAIRRSLTVPHKGGSTAPGFAGGKSAPGAR